MALDEVEVDARLDKELELVDDLDVVVEAVEDMDVVEDVEITLEVLDWVLEVEELSPLLALEESVVSLYMSSLLPAPQYSKLLPGQMKLQSPKAAKVDVASRVLPQ